MHRPNLTEYTAAASGDREPRICLQELMQIIMHGVYPSEQRLEYLLDRLEATT